jgi:molecular chaperone DnaK
MKLGEAMYKAQAAAAGGGDGTAGPGAGPGPGGDGAASGGHGKPGDDKVVDADFEEVDDPKKHKSA